MLETGPRRVSGRVRRAAACLAAALTLQGVVLAAAAPSEDELVRQIKIDVFDENWPAVLKGSEELLGRFPGSPAAPQASFYRARALSRSPGREAEAAAAFREFVAARPGEKLLVEQAWSAIFALACDARRQPTAGCVPTLSEGLASPSAYVSTLAAIRASDTRDERLRQRALAVLKRALATQSEPDIRNEILIAILKIDPREVPPPPARTAGGPAPPGPSAGAGPGHPPTLIRLTIFNKSEARYELKMNLPVAFAQMLISSLGPDEKEEIRAEAGRRGIDLGDIFEAIQKAGTGRFLDVDTPETRIELWIE